MSGVVAVVDDNKEILELLVAALDMFGFKGIAYSSSASFLEDRSARPACLIIDQNMPGMTGLELVARLRQDGNQIPVLLTTGSPISDVAECAARLHIERVHQKPTELDDFLSFVTRHC